MLGNKIIEQNYSDLFPGEIELYVVSQEFDKELIGSFYLIKIKIDSENHNQESILKYVRM